MTRRRTALAALAVALLALPGRGRGDGSDFFGASQAAQFQPELDLVQGLGDAFRVIIKLDPTFIPSQGYADMGVEVFGAWLVAPFTGPVLSPDIAKRRRLDVRLGAAWYPTLAAGSSGWSNLVQLMAEATMRTNFVGQVLGTLRGRVEARWQAEPPTSFVWRLRARPQLEREFVLDEPTRTSLTPFVNAEFIWTTSQDMWSQFRLQVGVQLGTDWFGAGQVIEVNGSLFTYLQPSRSYAPVLGLVWYQYF